MEELEYITINNFLIPNSNMSRLFVLASKRTSANLNTINSISRCEIDFAFLDVWLCILIPVGLRKDANFIGSNFG